MAKKRLVLVLGQNALGSNFPEQLTAVETTAKVIADFVQSGWQIVITHGNAPQMDGIHAAINAFTKHRPNHPSVPLSACAAMTQGYMGYELQNVIRRELLKRGINKTVSTVLTQVTVNPFDESSYTPMKVIGHAMTEEDARAEKERGNETVETTNGHRRIVAAPKPIAIVEMDAILALMNADIPVIAAGGGGIPVIEQENQLKGTSVFVEKDQTAALLAKEVDADVLMFFTNVDHVVLDYGTKHEVPISKMTVEDAEMCMKRGQFAAGAMSPKIEAAIDFINAGNGRKAIITSMPKGKAALAGKAGTTIY